MIDIRIPAVGESISEVTLVKWIRKTGDWVERDEMIAELESEKATFEINAEKAGMLMTIAQEGDTLKIGDVACRIDDAAVRPEQPVVAASPAPEVKPAPVVAPVPAPIASADMKATPVAAAIMADKKVDPAMVSASGSGGRIMKQDVLEALSNPGRKPGMVLFSRNERREKMSNLRTTVARRLVEAKISTAILTTFNAVDMSRIMDIRSKYKDKFKEIHGVGLGFMSFFTKACTFALQEWPAVNAYIDGDEVI